MKHDPLCLGMATRARFRHERGVCYCDLIDRVRQEQYALQSQTWEQGHAAGVAAARDAVAAIHEGCNCYEDTGIRSDALDAIDALRVHPAERDGDNLRGES